MTGLLDALTEHHIQLLLRLVLGGLLLLGGVTKLSDQESFRKAVAEYEMLPPALEGPFAALLPWMESMLGVLLLIGFGTVVAALLSLPLFLAFGVAIGLNLARGRNFDCHCFGSVHSESIGWTALLRAGVLAFVALVVGLGASRFGALEFAVFGSGSELPAASDVIPMVFMAAVVFDVLILLPEVVAFRTGFAQREATRITGVAHGNGHRHDLSSAEMEKAR